jgi:streptogramin lyase
MTDGPHAPPRYVRLVDVRNRRVAGICPEPQGDFAEQPVRFGPHNLHENRAGSYRSASLVFVTYFNAGLRVYDVADPALPVEVASWVPAEDEPQTNDLYVEADGRVWLTDRFTGGLYCIEPEPELAELMRARSL